jgi:hypothetical protein
MVAVKDVGERKNLVEKYVFRSIIQFMDECYSKLVSPHLGDMGTIGS